MKISRRIHVTICFLSFFAITLSGCSSPSDAPPLVIAASPTKSPEVAVTSVGIDPRPTPSPHPNATPHEINSGPTLVPAPSPRTVRKPISSNLPGMEKPASYTLSQLLERVKESNFDNEIEFQHVVQAKLSAQNSALNLLPHFSLNTILGVASLNGLTILKSVGDLVPFLLPSRWFHARGERFRSDAEYFGWILMKADSVNIVEGLVFSVERDQSAISRLETNEEAVRQIRDEIIEREHSGLMQVGSSDDITTVLNSIEKAISLLEENLHEEYTSLAQAEGFYNPDAIQSITQLPEHPIDDLLPPDPDAFSRVTLDVSLELRQMDSLIEYARWNRKERAFNWLDPSGDSSGGIGFGLGSYLAVGRSRQEEMQTKRQLLQSLLMEKVSDTVSKASQTLSAFQMAKIGSALQTRRIIRLTQNMRTGINFALGDMVSALQELARNDIEQVNAQYEYYSIQSKINRLTLSGPYKELVNADR